MTWQVVLDKIPTMANTKSTLLTNEELRVLYSPPTFSERERTEFFTFTNAELKTLKSFERVEYAVYFAISLAFFKLKYTLVNFRYRDVTEERQHVMKRYFPGKPTPRKFPDNKDVIKRIENKVLSVVGFSRFRGEIANNIVSIVQKQASSYPRQRQLCKALLNLMIKKDVAIPPITTIQSAITQIWNHEQTRVLKTYYRHTSKKQRQVILALLEKTDDHYRIVSIKKDMKAFNTANVQVEREKHEQLNAVFSIANLVLPKLRLPRATIEYYADLINYYNGPRLKQLNQDTLQLYLLCYSHSRFQVVNDNLLEAFKTFTNNLHSKADETAKIESADCLDELDKIRHKVCNLLMAIKNDTHETYIEKAKLYQCIPEQELEVTAQILMSDKLDKALLYWRYIDRQERSIILNLRPLFLDLDITILKNEALRDIVNLMREYFQSDMKLKLPAHIKECFPPAAAEYIFKDGEPIINRLEFFVYRQLAHHVDTNKLTLKHSIQHKQLEDNLINLPRWKREKPSILRSLSYPKLLAKSPKLLLEKQEHDSRRMYQKINADINNGDNEQLIIKTNQQGDKIWRLRPLEQSVDPNESLFKHFQKRGIADVMRFVDAKTGYSQALQESILPRTVRSEYNPENTDAVIFANAIRLGSRGMAAVCDLSLNDLLNAENNHVRMETVIQATQIVNTSTEKLEIFERYNIDGYRHFSLDGMKIGARISNIAARHSPKFLGTDAGVSSYNAIFNYLPIVGRLISSNKYEGNFTFELAHHQNAQAFKLERASTDRHGMNALNFALFDLTELEFAPRIPKMHNETLWGFGQHKEYSDLIITPHKMIKKDYIVDDWDNIQRIIASMLTGDAIPHVVIGKMASSKYRSKTKLALMHYNHIVRSNFILRCINDKRFRWAIECALNRGEAFNNLYRAIALLNGGKFRGQSEAEMLLWDQCSRLVASIIVYYNAYILNHLYVNAKSQAEKDLLIALSPGAWAHINMIGYYRFAGIDSARLIDQMLTNWDWQQALKME